MTLGHLYDDEFFDWVESGGIRSAKIILPFVKERVGTSSVVDIGCGSGGWLSVWLELGVKDILGVDGDYVSIDRLKIPVEQFRARDLNKYFAPKRKFDLVQSLEVAEHLLPENANRFVQQLCDLGDVILFSAAQPGQGGEWHVNERPLEYWRGLFRSHGFAVFDLIRLSYNRDTRIEPWYRYNSLIFANSKGRLRLSDDILSSEISDDHQLVDYSDWKWLFRRLILRRLPISLVTSLAKKNYYLRNAIRRGLRVRRKL